MITIWAAKTFENSMFIAYGKAEYACAPKVVWNFFCISFKNKKARDRSNS